MNCLRIGLLAAVSGSLLMAADGAGVTDESAVKASLPENVGRAIEAEFPGAKIEKAKKGNEGAVAVDLSFREKMVEVDVMADGTILKTEEVADIDAIPVPALKAILKASIGSMVKSVEINTVRAKIDNDTKTVTKLEKPEITYETKLERGRQKGELIVRGNGSAVKVPAWHKTKKAQ